MIIAHHIGPEFSCQIAAGKYDEVQILLGERRSNSTQILLGHVTRIVERFDE